MKLQISTAVIALALSAGANLAAAQVQPAAPSGAPAQGEPAAAAAGAAAQGEPAAAAAGAGAAAQGEPAAAAAGAGARTIATPDTVDAGQLVNVVVDGAPQGSTIELWGPVTQTGGGDRIRSVPLVGGTAGLVAPTETGSYQLRYLGPGGGRTLARAPFDVAAVPIALSVMTPAQPGGELAVEWQGPAAPGDRFEIVGASGGVVDAIPVVGDALTANASKLTAPTETGAYQLRYVSGRGAVLRAVGFEVR